uniref:Peptidase S1 domain-containing protein n=1 Tax=Heliothis virescens TaxID=7102 RepID=A0A2A4IT24_HELVI
MICTKDIVPDLSEICSEKYVDCTDVQYSDSEEGGRRRVLNPNQLMLHSAYHNESGRRQNIGSGGFCENDHGGPLVAGEGVNAMVIGIISACLVKENTNRCYGPFLYTSVYRNRALINCAVYKDLQSTCDKLFRSDVTHTETEISWADHPDGPAKNEIAKIAEQKEQEHKRRQFSPNGTEATNSSSILRNLLDVAQEHSGVVVRQDTEANQTSTPKVNSTAR